MRFRTAYLAFVFLSSTAPAQSVRPGNPLQHFSLARLGGGTVSTRAYAGKVLFFHFFAAGCDSCPAEVQRIEEQLWQIYRERGVQVIGIDTDDGAPWQYAGTHATFPIAINGGDIARRLGIEGSGFVIVDARGIIQYISPQSGPGAQRLQTAVAELRRVLGQSPMPREAARDSAAPAGFDLLPNVPNPFQQTTRLQLNFAPQKQEASIRLAIYDLLGREIQTLFLGKLPAGSYTFSWDGRSKAGQQVPPGLYFSVLESGQQRVVRRLIYLPQ